MEPQLLKLLRNLWFYIALFGLAPPIQKVPMSSKSASLSRSQVTMSRSQQTMNGMYAISGPYLLSPDWAAAVIRLTLATPALVSYFLQSACNTILYFLNFWFLESEIITTSLACFEQWHFFFRFENCFFSV